MRVSLRKDRNGRISGDIMSRNGRHYWALTGMPVEAPNPFPPPKPRLPKDPDDPVS